MAQQSTELTLTKCTNTAIAEFQKTLDSIKGVKDIVGLLNEDAQNERLNWVRRSLATYKAFAQVPQKERGKVLDELKAQMCYEKAYVYKIRTAGEKLIEFLSKGGNAENLPYSMDKFITSQKPAKPVLEKVVECAKIGSFTVDTIEYLIYKGFKVDSEGKKKPCNLYTKTANVTEIKVEILEKDGKETNKYFVGETEISVQFITL